MLYGKGQDPLEAATWRVKNNHGVHRLNAFADVVKCFHLGIWCWKGHDPVGSHTSIQSYHFKTFEGTDIGRAFDTYIEPRPHSYLPHVTGSEQDRIDCAIYIQKHLSEYLTEGIFNGGPRNRCLSVKNGDTINSINDCKNTWHDDVWEEHRNHIHIAV